MMNILAGDTTSVPDYQDKEDWLRVKRCISLAVLISHEAISPISDSIILIGNRLPFSGP
jgi:hypothetical protein